MGSIEKKCLGLDWWSRRILIALSIFLVNLTGCKEKPEKRQSLKERLPNIIYILADDLGYGDVGSFNPNGKIKTPNLDQLAQDGMKFTDAHTSSSVCTPTRYGILTGRYNWRSQLKQGVLTGKSDALISPSRTTVASILQKAGYHTGFIGKWHLGWNWARKDENIQEGEGWNVGDFDNLDFSKKVKNSPNDVGFDYAYGHSGSLDMAPYVYVENGKVTELPETMSQSTSEYGWWRKGPTSRDFVHDDVTPNFFRRANQYVRESAEQDKPFFLYLALPSPHTPILPTKEWKGSSGLNPYGDFVVMLDAYIGELVNTVQQAGIEKETLIVFTSDNGCSPAANIELLKSKGHNPSYIYRGHKADIFEGGHRVPFIAKWPAKIKPSTTSNQTICTTDFLATSAHITGQIVDSHTGEDSFSMVPLFENPNSSDYQREATVHHSMKGNFAIRKGKWKLIYCPGSGGWSIPKPNSEEAQGLPLIQLYNLSNDPGETRNLYKDFPEVTIELSQLMSKYITNGRSTPGPKVENEPGFDNKWKALDVLYERIELLNNALK